MSLKEILTEVDACDEIINQDLSKVILAARTYKTGQIKSAKNRKDILYSTYKEEVLKNSLLILVTGKRSAAFAKLAEEKFKCFSLDGKTFYSDILDKLNPQIYLNKSMNASVFDILGNILEDKMVSLDVIGYEALMFDVKYSRVVKDRNEMLGVITQSVNDTVGTEIIGIDLLEKVAQKGFEEKYKSRTIPIVLFSEDESFIQDINEEMGKMFGRLVTISAGEVSEGVTSSVELKAVSNKSVGEALKQIATNS